MAAMRGASAVACRSSFRRRHRSQWAAAGRRRCAHRAQSSPDLQSGVNHPGDATREGSPRPRRAIDRVARKDARLPERTSWRSVRRESVAWDDWPVRARASQVAVRLEIATQAVRTGRRPAPLFLRAAWRRYASLATARARATRYHTAGPAIDCRQSIRSARPRRRSIDARSRCQAVWRPAWKRAGTAFHRASTCRHRVDTRR